MSPGRGPRLTIAELRETALTLGLAAAAAGLFHLVGFPAPFLTGPAACVTIASLAGMRTAIPDRLRDLCFLGLGIGIGATVTPKALEAAAIWPFSILALGVALVIGMVVNHRGLVRLFGYDRDTAFLSSVPGHLSYVISLSGGLKVDQAKIGMIMSLRVLVMTLAVPVILGLTVETAGSAPAVAPMAWPIALGVFAASAVLGIGYHRMRLPAALLLGGMTVSGLLHATGAATGGLPPWATLSAFLVLGALIGTRFRGRRPADLADAALAGVLVTGVVLVISGLGALAMARLLDLSPALVFVAFAPGGLEAMVAMAVQLNLDPAFVAAHHVSRLLFLTVLVPVMMGSRWR